MILCYFSVRPLHPSPNMIYCAPQMEQGGILKEAGVETGKHVENKETIGRRKALYRLKLNATLEN